jgi:hypothetical protein
MVTKDPNAELANSLGRDAEQAPAMTRFEIAIWQQRMGYNDTDAMEALGIGSRHTWNKYKSEGAPRLVALAAAALESGIEPPRPVPNANLKTKVRHVVVNRVDKIIEGKGEREAFVADTRDGAVRWIDHAQKEFVHSGFEEKHARWWARNDTEPFELHYWWTETVQPGSQG